MTELIQHLIASYKLFDWISKTGLDEIDYFNFSNIHKLPVVLSYCCEYVKRNEERNCNDCPALGIWAVLAYPEEKKLYCIDKKSIYMKLAMETDKEKRKEVAGQIAKCFYNEAYFLNLKTNKFLME